MALGKNEWSLALLFAQAVGVAGALLVRLVGRPARHTPSPMSAVAGWSFSGLVLGNAASYFMDPPNYLAGFDILLSFSRSRIAEPNLLGRWALYVLTLVPYTMTLVMLMFASAFLLFARRTKGFPLPPVPLLLFVYSTALFIPYLLIPWSASPRYFSPAFIAFSITTVALCQVLPQRYAKRGVLVLCALLFTHPLIFFLSTTSDSLVSRSGTVHPQACVQLLSAADGVRHPQVDFITISLGKEYVENFLSHSGKRLCAYTWVP